MADYTEFGKIESQSKIMPVDANGNPVQIAPMGSVFDLFKKSTKTYVNGKQADLSVQTIDQEAYHKLVAEDKVIDNMIYAVSSDYTNVYGEQIKNVAAPVDPDDAATKSYVDSLVESIKPVDQLAQLKAKVQELDCLKVENASIEGLAQAYNSLVDAIVNS